MNSSTDDLERRVSRLANERSVLFERASTATGLSKPEQERLSAIERELDECFNARREARAARDINRFSRDGVRRTTAPRRTP